MNWKGFGRKRSLSKSRYSVIYLEVLRKIAKGVSEDRRSDTGSYSARYKIQLSAGVAECTVLYLILVLA
jgi:hypothetical protein